MSQPRITYDGVPFIITEKCVYDCHQGTDWHAADKQRRKIAKETNAWCFLLRQRITENYCFYSSNFLRGRVHVGIRWWDFTEALLTFVCILQYISFNLHQFSLHIIQCDCRWCIIYLQFVFIYFSSTSLTGGSWSVSDSAFGKVQVSWSAKKGVFPDR